MKNTLTKSPYSVPMLPARFAKAPRLARNLISRLLDQRAACTSASRVIGAPDGALGRVHSVTWKKDSVAISGQHIGDRVTISIDTRPEHDVTASPFDVTLPRPNAEAAVHITCISDGVRESVYLRPPSEKDSRRARQAALPHVLIQILGEWRGILGYLRSHDPNIARDIRKRLGLTRQIEGTYLPAGLFQGEPAAQPRHPPAIVVPVFNAFEDLDRLLSTFHVRIGCAHHLILVDDGSDDPRITARLQDHHAACPEATTILQLPVNTGFVAAANAGIDAARQITRGHVILLNTDTVPPENWVPRLLAPIEADPGVASATPMSNAAEILSVPRFGDNPLPSQRAIDRIDAVARGLSPRHAHAQLPTGVGFCMAMNRLFLDRLGGFDTAFGLGYGEEVDWCQKAKRAGGWNIGVGTLFVGHRGAASFGSEKKKTRIRAASAEIARRYPTYDSDVQSWCSTDPLAAPRLALSIANIGAEDGTVPIYLGHSLGGGAETALLREVQADLDGGCPGVVILRVGGPAAWRLELRTRDTLQIGEVAHPNLVMRLLQPIGKRRVIYSCGVGAAEPAAVPRFLLRLLTPGTPFEMRLHDFFPISPSWNLLDSDGLFRGVPDRNTRDPAHQVDGTNPLIHSDWRLLWGAVIARASEIRAFSQSSADLFACAYPKARHCISIRPHQTGHLPEPLEPGGQNIGVLGSINAAKGGAVLASLSANLRKRRLFIFGEMDGQFRLNAPHAVLGGYRQEDIAELARTHGIGAWLIPSVCPETFSFATHEALATGLPVIGFDIGAQGETLTAAPNGHVLPYTPQDISALLATIEKALSDQVDTRFRAAS